MARRILSFDVGLRHLAYAELLLTDAGDAVRSIERWGVIDVLAADTGKKPKKLGAEAQSAALIEALDEAFYDPAKLHYDVVLVENQPSRKNPAMKSVQVAILAYFATIRLHAGCVGEVRLISASRKLQQDDDPARSGVDASASKSAGAAYRARKAQSIAMCRSYLVDTLGDVRALAILDAAKKKDDLADALMQALAFLKGGCGGAKRKTKRAYSHYHK